MRIGEIIRLQQDQLFTADGGVRCTAQAYAEELGFDERKTQRHLRKFIDLVLIRRIGQGRATRYEVSTK